MNGDVCLESDPFHAMRDLRRVPDSYKLKRICKCKGIATTAILSYALKRDLGCMPSSTDCSSGMTQGIMASSNSKGTSIRAAKL